MRFLAIAFPRWSHARGDFYHDWARSRHAAARSSSLALVAREGGGALELGTGILKAASRPLPSSGESDAIEHHRRLDQQIGKTSGSPIHSPLRRSRTRT
jgi:hypothetical protein